MGNSHAGAAPKHAILEQSRFLGARGLDRGGRGGGCVIGWRGGVQRQRAFGSCAGDICLLINKDCLTVTLGEDNIENVSAHHLQQRYS